jgi:inorganic pyrophosphatase
MDFPTMTGCVVKSRLIGCIRGEQKEKDGTRVRNDRFIAIADHARTLADVKGLFDLRCALIDEPKAFFVQYNTLAGKMFTPLGDCGAKKALSLVETGRRNALKKP